jgi:S1-C subfamily serine protease
MGYVYSLDVLSDLAIIKITSNETNFEKVEFGSETRVGDWVVAIGSPLGLHNTVTCGIISSNDRMFFDIGGKDQRVKYIQTDCVVHSGSSGGPLINIEGQVVGINATRTEGEGIRYVFITSFAIRIDTVLDMINQLLRKGRVVRPYLGINLTSLTPEVVKQLTLPPPSTEGVLITKVLFF